MYFKRNSIVYDTHTLRENFVQSFIVKCDLFSIPPHPVSLSQGDVLQISWMSGPIMFCKL